MIDTLPPGETEVSEDKIMENIYPCETREVRNIPKKHYINKINYANFKNIPLKVFFRHKIHSRELCIEGNPLPCMNDELEITWNNSIAEEKLCSFDFQKILVPDAESFLVIESSKYNLTQEGIILRLPETAFLLNNRKRRRFEANNISAQLFQNSSLLEGRLADFSPDGFRIRLNPDTSINFKCLNRENSLSVILKKDKKVLFSGECRIDSVRGCTAEREFVVSPLNRDVKRYKSKKFRGERHEPGSAAYLSFIHPFSGNYHHLKINDISGSGLSVREEEACPALIPGLLLPDSSVILPGGEKLSCMVQVIYTTGAESLEKDQILSGLVILDMNPREHNLLLNYIHQEKDNCAFVSIDTDMDSLWNFFFDSGFIYPEKYLYILENREKIKSLYEKLYNQSPGIARHFIYREADSILGHMSMIRSYENSWLLHHHASSLANSHNAGIHVLNQAGSFCNNSFRIAGFHLDYLMCYYQSCNKFPRRVFGDMAEKTKDPKSFSLDNFAYFHIKKPSRPVSFENSSLIFEKSTRGDIKDLNCFYENISGGLMIDAFNLMEGNTENPTLADDYRKSGINRKIEFYSLKKEGELAAVIMADQSETGLNMSDLTNSFKVFAVNQHALTREMLEKALYSLCGFFPDSEQIPVLLYPHTLAEELDFIAEKIYTLWIMSTEAGDKYFRFLNTILRVVNH